MHPANAKPRFCVNCGGELVEQTSADRAGSFACSSCKKVQYQGPEVLTLTLLFAEGRILFMKRGVPPYVGQWAPPGGYVEANEALEAAAAHEIEEEVGIQIPVDALIPHAIVSLPSMNQIYVCFIGVLEKMITPRPNLPECTDARWFTMEDYSRESIWEPAAGFDMQRLVEQVRTGHFHFYQRTNEFVRVFGPNTEHATGA